MQEIEQLLNNNMGNRLTPELIIGLHAMISHHVNRLVADEVKKAVIAAQGADKQPEEAE